MKNLITLLLLSSNLIVVNNVIADDEQFEINQKNCNLPMSKIRQLLPEQDDSARFRDECMAKATSEHWKKSKQLQASTNTQD